MDINIHLYLSTYVCIYLYVLKTMSSFQCLQFHSSATGSLFFFFCICGPFSYREKPVSHSFCHSTHGHSVYITTATAVAKTVQKPLHPTLACLSLSHRAAAQLSPTQCLLGWIRDRWRRPAVSLSRRSPHHCHLNCFPVGLPLFLTIYGTSSSLSFGSNVTSDI